MKYFKLEEFYRSKTADEYNETHIEQIINRPKSFERCAIENNINDLVDNVLDPLREIAGQPIYITSGFRCPKLNRLVRGSNKSQHLSGQAADITLLNPQSNLWLAHYISTLVFDQLILEGQQRDKYTFAWIHVSYKNDRSKNRKQILLAEKVGYKPLTQKELQSLYLDSLKQYPENFICNANYPQA